MIPTRWRTLFDDQLTDAAERIEGAYARIEADEGGRAMQAAYQAVVTAAGIRVWMTHHPWETTLPAAEMRRHAVDQFPSQYAALAALDLPSLLRGFWSPESAKPYVDEARAYVGETREQFEAWIAAN